MLNFKNIDSNKLYSVGELAIILSCSERTARKKLKKIEHIKDGRCKIPGYAIKKYIKKHTEYPDEL